MNYAEKLHKAVEMTLTAGYQLDKDAFEFLNVIASTEDPTEIMNKALQRLGKVKDKPLFIERRFLEDLLKEIYISEKMTPCQEKEEIDQKWVMEGKKLFHPYAKEVESNIKVIEDPGSKLCTSGNLTDYLEYFRDRFKRMERILRQRIDVKSATSIIEALKAPPNTKLKIIGMVTEKREFKQKIILVIEDLQASATLFIPQSAPKELLNKASKLLLDQVICVSVTKTRSNMLMVDDIILPDVAQKQQNKAPVPVYAALTSDLHIGSTKFQEEALKKFFLWLNGKYGNEKMREIAGRVKYVLIAGDIVDGIGIYPNQRRELAVKDIYGQYKLAAKFIEQIPDYIEVVIIPGNHDAPRRAQPQPPISGEFLELLEESRNIYSLGNPSYLSLHKVEVLMYHGRSLDDIFSTVPGMEHSRPEKAMTLLLQCRHLAPVYGGKTPLSPENKDFLVIERTPDIFHAGHIHILGYTNYRGVLVVNSGCWQAQTSYMRMQGLTPTPNMVPVVNLKTFDVEVLSFS